MKLSVIVPAFNERGTIGELLRRVCAVPIDKEVIVVDDGSTDGTIAELRRLGLAVFGDPVIRQNADGTSSELRLIAHHQNAGKGTSIRDGLTAATGDIILIQDADLEYDPTDYVRLVQPILDGRADVVYGSRFAGTTRRVLFFWHTMGNRVLTLLSNAFTNLDLSDMETCYKVFRAELVKDMPLRSRRFGIEPELTAKFARKRARVYEVPISYAGRSYLEGKKIGWRDGLATVSTILKYAVVDDLENTDPGYKTLQRIEVLHQYSAWLWDRLAPYVGDRVLEVGAGLGNMTRQLGSRELVVATDVDPEYVWALRNTFANDPQVRVCRFDIEADEAAEDIGSSFDTVLAVNVLQHVEDDVGALRRLSRRLGPQGRVVLVVPALHRLYGTIDRAIGHRRRYERQELRDKLEAAGFTVEHLSAFNLAGACGWYVNSRLLKRRVVPGLQARINNLLVPLLQLEERLGCPAGLSLAAVGRRPA